MHAPRKDPPAAGGQFVEEVEVRGHIIDSLILPKILDAIATNGGTCRMKHITIGQLRNDPSHAVMEVRAASEDQLQKLLALIADHGAVPTDVHDCTFVEADIDGAYPEDFYSTTNQRTEVRVGGRWLEVADQEMDCAILVDPQPTRDPQAGAPGARPPGASPWPIPAAATSSLWATRV